MSIRPKCALRSRAGKLSSRASTNRRAHLLAEAVREKAPAELPPSRPFASIGYGSGIRWATKSCWCGAAARRFTPTSRVASAVYRVRNARGERRRREPHAHARDLRSSGLVDGGGEDRSPRSRFVGLRWRWQFELSEASCLRVGTNRLRRARAYNAHMTTEVQPFTG